ncbi:BaiN/RdsA family NAD(P)/FAD-dependent oxidoreductase [Sediminibacterium soli]|uniref:NAD(P)/FAD-dependent oxidoreductase n=1 Tax=Sediminibacterium soli TaxID=2698829 RepID=UPI00137A9261|nr:NAD(P)/FAD-dependent oxidoreductase [Sediminibacterium soli]NCI45755.1 NAD(P)/FAD-dependent oxidoreductase [Sediminibacterium soli]
MSGKLVVIGGGAAGFFCAVNAARQAPGLQVTIIEKSNKLLSKVKVSGGGRCNTTHACFDIAELSRKYPRGQHFVKKTFHWFNPTHTIEWFAVRGVPLKTEADGRMFPVTDNSQTIIDCLLKEAGRYQVDIRMQCEVKRIERNGSAFRVHVSEEEAYEADYLLIATGGYPKSAMFDWLRATGHSVEEPVPSLFTFNMPGHAITQLMGLSVEKATVKVNGTKLVEQGPLLITHWGMSGPVVLRLSAWGARQLAALGYQFSITVNWLSDYNEQSLREAWQSLREQYAAQKIGNKNPFGLPARLWTYLLQQAGIGEQLRWSDLPSKEQNQLIRQLTAQEFVVNGKTTFKDEFVTCGGIRLSEIDPNTMQSRIVPHLYFAGEVMDVDGITGGFNFQHAWTSGWLAAQSIASPA